VDHHIGARIVGKGVASSLGHPQGAMFASDVLAGGVGSGMVARMIHDNLPQAIEDLAARMQNIRDSL